jgi:hypothetical protein
MIDKQGERGCLKKVKASRATIRPTQTSDWVGYLWIAGVPGVPTTDSEAISGRMSQHEESGTKHACKSLIDPPCVVGPRAAEFEIQMKAWEPFGGTEEG